MQIFFWRFIYSLRGSRTCIDDDQRGNEAVLVEPTHNDINQVKSFFFFISNVCAAVSLKLNVEQLTLKPLLVLGILKHLVKRKNIYIY